VDDVRGRLDQRAEPLLAGVGRRGALVEQQHHAVADHAGVDGDRCAVGPVQGGPVGQVHGSEAAPRHQPRELADEGASGGAGEVAEAPAGDHGGRHERVRDLVAAPDDEVRDLAVGVVLGAEHHDAEPGMAEQHREQRCLRRVVLHRSTSTAGDEAVAASRDRERIMPRSMPARGPSTRGRANDAAKPLSAKGLRHDLDTDRSVVPRGSAFRNYRCTLPHVADP
jgi:hypothetical protein